MRARREEDQMRQQMLSRVLSREAQERLNNVQAVDPKRARRIGDHIIGMARSGQLLQEVRAPHCRALGADARAVATGARSPCCVARGSRMCVRRAGDGRSAELTKQTNPKP